MYKIYKANFITFILITILFDTLQESIEQMNNIV
jgi:hypothetical protein